MWLKKNILGKIFFLSKKIFYDRTFFHQWRLVDFSPHENFLIKNCFCQIVELKKLVQSSSPKRPTPKRPNVPETSQFSFIFSMSSKRPNPWKCVLTAKNTVIIPEKPTKQTSMTDFFQHYQIKKYCGMVVLLGTRTVLILKATLNT